MYRAGDINQNMQVWQLGMAILHPGDEKAEKRVLVERDQSRLGMDSSPKLELGQCVCPVAHYFLITVFPAVWLMSCISVPRLETWS